MAFEFNDLKGFLFLVLFTVPQTTTTNIDCSGKPFYCLNSTHFMICVDLGSGVSSTIDDFVIPCPSTTVCHIDNRFECEFPTIEVPPPLLVIGVTTTKNIDIPTINEIVTETPQTDVATMLPAVGQFTKTDSPLPKEETSQTKALKSLQEEFTGGNEKINEVHPSLPNITASSSHNLNNTWANHINTSDIITVSNEPFNAKLTTETSTYTTTKASITDEVKQTDITTPTTEVNVSTPKGNKKTKEQSPSEKHILESLKEEFTDGNEKVFEMPPILASNNFNGNSNLNKINTTSDTIIVTDKNVNALLTTDTSTDITTKAVITDNLNIVPFKPSLESFTLTAKDTEKINGTSSTSEGVTQILKEVFIDGNKEVIEVPPILPNITVSSTSFKFNEINATNGNVNDIIPVTATTLSTESSTDITTKSIVIESFKTADTTTPVPELFASSSKETSPTKIRILENIKKEFTDANEKLFEEAPILQSSTVISSNQFNENTTTKLNSNYIVSVHDKNFSTELTTETWTDTTAKINITDDSKSLDTTTPIVELYSLLSKDTKTKVISPTGNENIEVYTTLSDNNISMNNNFNDTNITNSNNANDNIITITERNLNSEVVTSTASDIIIDAFITNNAKPTDTTTLIAELVTSIPKDAKKVKETTPTIIHLLENIKEDFTDGNEKVFEDPPILSKNTIISSNKFNETSNTKVNSNDIIAVNNQNLNTELTTEPSADITTDIFITDNFNSSDITTPVPELSTLLSKDTKTMNVISPTKEEIPSKFNKKSTSGNENFELSTSLSNNNIITDNIFNHTNTTNANNTNDNIITVTEGNLNSEVSTKTFTNIIVDTFVTDNAKPTDTATLVAELGTSMPKETKRVKETSPTKIHVLENIKAGFTDENEKVFKDPPLLSSSTVISSKKNNKTSNTKVNSNDIANGQNFNTELTTEISTDITTNVSKSDDFNSLHITTPAAELSTQLSKETETINVTSAAKKEIPGKNYNESTRGNENFKVLGTSLSNTKISTSNFNHTNTINTNNASDNIISVNETNSNSEIITAAFTTDNAKPTDTTTLVAELVTSMPNETKKVKETYPIKIESLKNMNEVYIRGSEIFDNEPPTLPNIFGGSSNNPNEISTTNISPNDGITATDKNLNTELSTETSTDTTNNVIATDTTDLKSTDTTTPISTINKNVVTKNIVLDNATNASNSDTSITEITTHNTAESTTRLQNETKVIQNDTSGFNKTISVIETTTITDNDTTKKFINEQLHNISNILNKQDKEETLKDAKLDAKETPIIALTTSVNSENDNHYSTTPNPLNQHLMTTASSSYRTIKDSNSGNLLTPQSVSQTLDTDIIVFNEKEGVVAPTINYNTTDNISEITIPTVKIAENGDIKYQHMENTTFTPQFAIQSRQLNTITSSSLTKIEGTSETQNYFTTAETNKITTDSIFTTEQTNINGLKSKHIQKPYLATTASSERILTEHSINNTNKTQQSLTEHFITTGRNLNKTENPSISSATTTAQINSSEINNTTVLASVSTESNVEMTSIVGLASTELNKVNEINSENTTVPVFSNVHQDPMTPEQINLPSFAFDEPNNTKASKANNKDMMFNHISNVTSQTTRHDNILVTPSNISTTIIKDATDNSTVSNTMKKEHFANKLKKQNEIHSLAIDKDIASKNVKQDNISNTKGHFAVFLPTPSQVITIKNVSQVKYTSSESRTIDPLLQGTESPTAGNWQTITNNLIAITETSNFNPTNRNVPTEGTDINLAISTRANIDLPKTNIAINAGTDVSNAAVTLSPIDYELKLNQNTPTLLTTAIIETQTAYYHNTLTSPKVVKVEESQNNNDFVSTRKSDTNNSSKIIQTPTSSVNTPNITYHTEHTNAALNRSTTIKPSSILGTIVKPISSASPIEFIFINETVINNSSPLQSKSHPSITTHKEALLKKTLDATMNGERPGNLSQREDMYLDTGNNSLVENQMNIETSFNKEDNEISNEQKYDLTTAYLGSPSQIEITTATAYFQPLVENKRLPNDNMYHQPSVVTATKDKHNLLPNVNHSIPVNDTTSESRKTITAGNPSIYVYSSVNNSVKVFNLDKQANNSDESDIRKTNMEGSNPFRNLTQYQNITRDNFEQQGDKLHTSITQGSNLSDKQSNVTNNKEKVASSYTKDFTASNSLSSKSNLNITSSSFDCWNNTRGKYADSKDCRKFYICLGKLDPIVGICPNNTVFSEINKQCTRNLSHCVRNNQFHCLYEGRFSDVLKDNIYYICVKHNLHFLRYKLQCQSGYHLNKYLVKCEQNVEMSSQSGSSTSENSQLNDQNEAAIVTNTGVQMESEKIETSETGKDETAIGKPAKLEIGKGEQSEKGKAEKAETGKNEKSEKNDEFKCKKEGKFPYEKDCTKYYVCSKNKKDEYRRKIKKCSNDEVYDKDNKKCISAESNEC